MRIGVIGGGATGLTAGYVLAGEGHEVTVFHKDPIGGLAHAMSFEDTAIEPLYHHIFSHDTCIISLIEELGLADRLLWEEARNGIYINGRMYPFSKPVDLLMFPEISMLSRIRMGVAVLRAKNQKDHLRMESLNAREWLIKNTGKASYETVWKPLLRSKFEQDAAAVSGVWIWNKFKLRGSSRNTLGGERLGYLKGSFQSLYDALDEHIRKKGGNIRREEVRQIAPGENGTVMVQGETESVAFDKVVFTGAPSQLCAVAAFPDTYMEKLRQQKYKANICAMIVLDRPISDYYWLTIADEKAPFVLFIEHTNMVKDEAYHGKHVIYLSRYLDVTDADWGLPDETILDVFLAYLKKLFPAFSMDHILHTSISRSEFSQPVIYQEYSKRILPFETPIENLYLASMAQIYPEDRGQNYAVSLGRKISSFILSQGDI